MNPPPSPPTSALDQSAARWFAEEVEPHEFRLRAWLAGRFPQLRDVDDVVQDTYVRLFRARRSGAIRSVQAFLFTAARNSALDIFRRRKASAADSLYEVAGLSVLDERPNAAESADASQELEILAEAIRHLPHRCRQVFTLRKIYGLSQREVAAHLEISEHTVEVQMGKGARRCADYLRARGITR
ncbi:MAG: RNA polymerase sigma factor [Verrucomicrobia bacterium]|nr:RNA polymerase sigma factor [Verrucomicrobiota bacterium]